MARSINQTLKKKIFRIGSLGSLALSVSGLLGSAGVNADGYSQYLTTELTQLHDRNREATPLESTQDMRLDGRRDPGPANHQTPDNGWGARGNEERDRGRSEIVGSRSRNEYGSSGYGYGYERRQAQGGFDGGIGHGLRGRSR